MKYIILFFFTILSFGQQTSKVDFIKCEATIEPNFESKSIVGKIVYEFKVLTITDSIRIDAIKMKFLRIKLNGKEIEAKNNDKELILYKGFKKGFNKLELEYQAFPKQTVYFTGTKEDHQIWTQGQGKYTSHWLPSFDDENEKVIFNLNVVFDNDFHVISNGRLSNKVSNGNKNVWNYTMHKPMSSYLVMLAIGKFKHKSEISKSGILLENYYKPIDEEKYLYTFMHSKFIFDFFEKEIGVNYPWEIYRQIPVEDFLYAGMENTSSTLFSQDFVVDESGFNDRNYINVNAHELAHQWFGNLVTAKSGKHHWLQEGFATYYALLAERELFGDDYFYNALYKSSLQLKQVAKTDTIPLLNEKASSLSFYQKGAWALHTIREEIGAKKFQKSVKAYLKKYSYKNVETSDFLNEVAKVSKFDIVKFQKKWLDDFNLQTEQVNLLLEESEYIRKLFKIKSYKNNSFTSKNVFFTEVLNLEGNYLLKKEIVYQMASIPFEVKKDLLIKALNSKNIEVRQAVAETFTIVPKDFKIQYETLLNDNSYNTKQTALITLWKSFPEDHGNYLEIAKDWKGKNDKELRITFLSLYQTYKSADEVLKLTYLNELINYTSPNYESSIRQNAIENALQIIPKNQIVLKNLVNATTHHKWQFVKFARDKIRELLLKEEYKTVFKNLLLELNVEEQNQLNRLF